VAARTVKIYVNVLILGT